MKLLIACVVALSTLESVFAHGTTHARVMHPREISRRQVAANDRHIAARNCASELAAFHNGRKMARREQMVKRQVTSTLSAIPPHYTEIQNTTCVTAPEVTEGPYYINNDLLRQDIRDGEPGVLLELDIGVLDTSTCKPLPQALVELWHCNSTGAYSGFTGLGVSAADDKNDLGTYLLPRQGPGGPGGGTGKTDDLNFLRGGFETNSAGLAAFTTVYPGFYTGRTIHIHTMVHQDVTYASNGTFISKSGSLVHIGQLFFEETLNNAVMAVSPYTQNRNTRTLNSQDGILRQENSNGYNAFVDTEYLGSTVKDGILGYITIGVDSRAEYSIQSNNYYEEADALALVGVSDTDV